MTLSVSQRLDSLTKIIQNRLAGVGGSQDKVSYTTIEYVKDLTHSELTELYNNSDMCARVIDVPADLMTTTWINLELAKSEEDGTVILDKLKDYESKLGIRSAFNQAAKWAFLYGRSYIILGIDDGRPLHQPVNTEKIKSIKYLLTLEQSDVVPALVEMTSVKPEYYQVTIGFQQIEENIPKQEVTPYKYFLVHKSRILIFDGVSTPPRSINGYSDSNKSKLQRFFQPYVEYYLAWNAISAMLVDYDVYIHSYEGLVELLAQNGEEKLRQHMEDIHLMRSTLKMLLIDGNFEDGKFLNRNVSGIDKVVEKLEQRLTLAADMPYMYFWGQVGRAGMGDSGDAERALMQQKTFFNQENMFRHNIKRLYEYIFLAKDGPTKGSVPEQWSFDFNPIIILNPQQEAEIRHKDALTLERLIQNNVITPGEGRSLNAGNHYTSDITLNPSVKPIYEYMGKGEVITPNQNRDPVAEYERKKENIELGKKENLDQLGTRKITVSGYEFLIYHEPGTYIDYAELQCPRSYLGVTPVLFGPSLQLPYGFVAQNEEEAIIGFGFFEKEAFRLTIQAEFLDPPTAIKKLLNEEIIQRWKDQN